jgi:hypothetical protein
MRIQHPKQHYEWPCRQQVRASHFPLDRLGEPQRNKNISPKSQQNGRHTSDTRCTATKNLLDNRAPSLRTKNNLESCPSRHRKSTRRIIESITIRIRTNLFRTLAVIVGTTCLCRVMFVGAAIFSFAGFAAQRETGVEWETGITDFFHWVKLEVPGTPVGDVSRSHF